MALADLQDLVDALVRDSAGVIAAAQRDAAIALAVNRYSHDRPRVITVDLTADGTAYLDLPEGWETDFSQLVSLEYPLGDLPPTLIDHQLYDTPTATRIMLATAITGGETVRARYTVAHVLDADTDTVPARDREAVALWAASLLLAQLAAAASGDTAPTIASDTVDHGGGGDRYARRAAALKQSYFDQLGLDPKRSVAAGVVVALPIADSRGQRRIFHPPPGVV